MKQQKSCSITTEEVVAVKRNVLQTCHSIPHKLRLARPGQMEQENSVLLFGLPSFLHTHHVHGGGGRIAVAKLDSHQATEQYH